MIIADIEASGTNPYKHSIVSVGAVDFDNPENQFYEECKIWDGAHIEEEALAVNGFTKKQITDPSKQGDKELLEKFLLWAEPFKDRTLAGQNPSFDRDFLQATAERYHVNWKFAHRTLDLHSICYFHIVGRGKQPPFDRKKRHSALNLDAILRYVGLPKEPEPHNGLTGAKMEAEAFSRILRGEPLFAEYQKYALPWN